MAKEVPVINQDLSSERSSLERQHLQLAQKERQLLLREEQLQQEHSKEINVLRQENYMLQSKVSANTCSCCITSVQLDSLVLKLSVNNNVLSYFLLTYNTTINWCFGLILQPSASCSSKCIARYEE